MLDMNCKPLSRCLLINITLFYTSHVSDVCSQMVSSLSGLLKLLSEYRFKEYYQIPIRRTHVLVDALRAAWRPAFTSIKTLTVRIRIKGVLQST